MLLIKIYTWNKLVYREREESSCFDSPDRRWSFLWDRKHYILTVSWLPQLTFHHITCQRLERNNFHIINYFLRCFCQTNYHLVHLLKHVFETRKRYRRTQEERDKENVKETSAASTVGKRSRIPPQKERETRTRTKKRSGLFQWWPL